MGSKPWTGPGVTLVTASAPRGKTIESDIPEAPIGMVNSGCMAYRRYTTGYMFFQRKSRVYSPPRYSVWIQKVKYWWKYGHTCA